MYNNIGSIIVILTLIITPTKIDAQDSLACKNLHGNDKFNGTCTFVDECTGAALRGSCINTNHVCCIKDTPSTYTPKNPIINLGLFIKVVGNTPRNNALYNWFAEALEISQINTPNRAAAFLATLAGETNNFRDLESPINDADDVFGNSAPGDGSLFRGRGAILVRGKDNYISANNSHLTLGNIYIYIYIYI